MIPRPDRDSEPYWDALSRGTLAIQNCRDCGAWTWPARPICSRCHGDNLDWKPVSGAGEIASWVVAHRALSPDLAAHVPYTIALVRIDEQDDILIPGRLLDGDAAAGLRVEAVAEKVADGIGALSWRAAMD